MNRTHIQAGELYLRQLGKIDAMIESRLKERRRWVRIAEGLGSADISERVKSTGHPQRGADAILEYVELDRQIEALRLRRGAILRTVERLPVVEYSLICKLYVDGMTMKEAASRFDRSYEWVKKRKRKALELVGEMVMEGSDQNG